MLLSKNLFRGLAAGALLANACLAQQNPPNAAPEAWEFKEMMLQSSAATKVAMLEQYRNDFQKAELIPWAYEEICRALEAEGQLDRALAVGQRLLALDPQSVEIAQKGLQLAEKKQDAVLIRQWSDAAAHAADSVLSSPLSGQSRMEVARSVRVYTDYLAYSAIVKTADSAAKRTKLEEFLQRNRNSTYRTAVEDLYLETWRESGDAAGTLEAARRILEQDECNVAALAIVAENYMQGENEPKKLLAYATHILALLDSQQKPVGISAAEWSRKKALLEGRANWMMGRASIQLDKFKEADKSIRVALPYLKGDSKLTSAALFYLGWANYRMGRVSDAIRFNQQCILVKGPFQEYAAKNLVAIQAETTSQN